MTTVRKQARGNSLAEEGESPARRERELLEGVDYYLENGLLVFTAAFLEQRGYCCESGCRHCPYRDTEKLVE